MSLKYISLSLILMTFLLNVTIKSQTAQNKIIPTLTYSELIENKERYFGETVRVKAFHIYGFEWSFLCDGDCKGGNFAWVEVVADDELCKGSIKKIKKGRDDFDNKAEVVYIGKLISGSFGHLGAYPYQFTVSCVESHKKLKLN